MQLLPWELNWTMQKRALAFAMSAQTGGDTPQTVGSEKC